MIYVLLTLFSVSSLNAKRNIKEIIATKIKRKTTLLTASSFCKIILIELFLLSWIFAIFFLSLLAYDSLKYNIPPYEKRSIKALFNNILIGIYTTMSLSSIMSTFLLS